MARAKKAVTNELILATIINLGERVAELPTKTATDGKFDEVLTELKALSRAVDKDAVTSIKHDRRITRVEKHLHLA